MEIDIQLTLRGPLADALIAAASRNGEEPVVLLARSIDRMITAGKLDTAENSRPPRLFDLENFWVAARLASSNQEDRYGKVGI